MDATRARLVETHTALALFVGERVYKLKKPVSLGFLDFTSRSAREAACHREVTLNRRLAPDVYLGVADVLDESGMPCDHLVVMRRLPDELRLATLVQTPRDMRPDIRGIARAIAAFHAGAARSAQIDESATPAAVLALWEETIEQTRRFAGPLLDAGTFDHVARAARRFLRGRAALFDSRIAGGDICDGHGDLLADDVFCCADGPRILDCLEFDARFRHGDVLADLAFLCMDLERLHRPDLAEQLLADYEEFSGRRQPHPLLHHYVAYRALVRCKVACLRHAQGDGEAAHQARALLKLAFRHAERARVRLLLVGGPPGSGKSTLAAGLAAALGATLLRSDEVRLDVGGAQPGGDSANRWMQGRHDAATTASTYAEMLHRARSLLEAGESVVLDATWADRHHRHAARRLAWRTASDVCELRCEVPAEVAAQRVAERLRRGDDVSDATPGIAARLAAEFDPWPSATPIDTTCDVPLTLARALRTVAHSGRAPRDFRPPPARPSPLARRARREPASTSAPAAHAKDTST